MPPITGRESARGRRELDPGTHGLTTENVPRPATGPGVFGNDHLLELEVGSGKGTFLLGESSARPDVNFLGIEYARRYWLFAADRLRRAERANARVVLAEAYTFLRDFLQDESLAGVHVYFPDPWPKTRHHKRRLLKPKTVALLATKMMPGARLSIATDHREYFEEIQAAVGISALIAVPFGSTAAALPEELVGSNFERKYRLEGRPLFTLSARKRG
ncbi:MAG: tRNA (guanine(46)-N(7))-methyltransferase TrmB [Vicinamibacteria bacterium]